jgi:nucleoid-associated protein EbfC
VTINPPNPFEGWIENMSQVQRELESAEASVSAAAVEGTAGGGAVVARASGSFSFDSISIDPSLCGGADHTVLEDLVLAAVRNAVDRLTEHRRQAVGGLVSGALGGLFNATPIGEPDEG